MLDCVCAFVLNHIRLLFQACRRQHKLENMQYASVDMLQGYAHPSF